MWAALVPLTRVCFCDWECAVDQMAHMAKVGHVGHLIKVPVKKGF